MLLTLAASRDVARTRDQVRGSHTVARARVLTLFSASEIGTPVQWE